MDSARIGNFSSSQISRLVNPKKIDTYIKEKNRERRLGIEINIETNSRSQSWGKALEGYVFSKHLETSWQLVSQNTDIHPSRMWCGTKDVISKDTVGDIKCPFTRTSFCDLVEIIEFELKGEAWEYLPSKDRERLKIENFKKENPEYYWQLVSNSILTNVDFAELIVWIPYQSEILGILSFIELIDDFDVQKSIQWLIHVEFNEIPHIPDTSRYKNINRFRFEVPKADKELLENAIKEAYPKLDAIPTPEEHLENS